MWVVGKQTVTCTVAHPVAQQTVNAALELALRRHKNLFFQKPQIQKNTVLYDGSLFSRTVLEAIFAESLELLLDEIEKPTLSALRTVMKRHSKTVVSGPRKWVPALDGTYSEEEFAVAVHREMKRRLKERERKVRELLKRKVSTQATIRLMAEVKHVWDQMQELGIEAQETVCTTLLDPKLVALERKLS